MISAEKIKKKKKWNRSEENSRQCEDYVNTKHCLLNYSWKHKIKLFTRRICFFFSASQIARDKSSECTVLKGFHLRTFSVSWLQSIIYLSGILVPPHVSSKHSSIEHFFFHFHRLKTCYLHGNSTRMCIQNWSLFQILPQLLCCCVCFLPPALCVQLLQKMLQQMKEFRSTNYWKCVVGKLEPRIVATLYCSN